VLELDGHVALGPADQLVVEHPVVDRVDQLGGSLDRGQLAAVLDRPQLLDDARAGHQLDVGRQQLAQAPMRFHGQIRVIEAEPLDRQIGQRRVQLLRTLDAIEVLDFLLGLGDVAEVGHEAPHVAPHHREPVRAREARHVAQVRRLGDEQRVDVLQAPRDPVRPTHASAALSISSPSR
jgi:hypothetical protein